MHFLRKQAYFRISAIPAVQGNQEQGTKERAGAFFISLVRHTNEQKNDPIVFALNPTEAGRILYFYDKNEETYESPPHMTQDPANKASKHFAIQKVVREKNGKTILSFIVSVSQTNDKGVVRYSMALDAGEFRSIIAYIERYLLATWPSEGPQDR